VISLSRNGKPSLLLSPNSVLANALLRSIDILRPRVLSTRPARIEFVVGTQINGAPHLGTNLVQTAAFLLAKISRREFSIDTSVRFGALDNAPYDVVLDPETHSAYQQTYFHALGKDGIGELIERYYRAFFDSVSGGYRHGLRGGDDGALRALGTPPARMPSRIFTPQVLAPTGRSCPNHCCASRAGTSCPLMSSPGCSTPPPGPARLTTTSTRWSGWSANC
jgi:hypothetical protein